MAYNAPNPNPHQLFTTHQTTPVSNDTETEDDDALSDDSDGSENIGDKKRRVAFAVKEDMAKLERMCEEKGMRYRLMDRIGEGFKPSHGTSILEAY